jgi:hypothetical protein
MATLNIGPHGFPQWEKDPAAEKDYSVDWTAWLAGDTITTHTVTVQTGLTKLSDLRNGAVVTIWLAGGSLGRTYKVVVHVETAGGRKDDRTLEIVVKDQ